LDYVFLFTDLEGSSRLWESEPERMRGLMARHDALLREAVAKHAGAVVKMAGDGVHAVFADARRSVDAAIDLQLAMRALEKETGLPIRVRCGLHTGPAEQRDEDFYGPTVNRAARLANAANGGQIVLSAAMVEKLKGGLAEPLGLLPLGSVRLRDLSTAEAVHQLTHPHLQNDFPPLRSLSTNPNNLPALATSFIGRYKEVGQVRELFTRGRIVTLAGAGGIGKTRLALQSAAYLLDRYPDGVWFVEFAHVQSGDALAGTILGALGVKQSKSDPMTTLAGHMKPLHTLLVLDNCEHVIDAVAHLADSLVKAAPGLHLIATSRETLDIDGEQVLNVPTLALPDPDHEWDLDRVMQVESVRMLIERTLAHRPDFQPRGDDAAALARIAYRLDGIPLAIELAAARLRAMTLAELNLALDDRFGTLTTGTRVAQPRHKTLHGLIDWSYQLLGAEEQALFHALTVFVGGWSQCAAESVCAGTGLQASRIAPLLESLADKSLVLKVNAEVNAGEGAGGNSAEGSATRYRMLETLREFASARLTDAEHRALRRRHADWVIDYIVVQHQWRRQGADIAAIGPLFAIELPNLRAALQWLDEHHAADHLKAISNLAHYMIYQGMLSEASRHLDNALARFEHEGDSEDLAYALQYRCGSAYLQGDMAAVLQRAPEASAMFGRLGDEGRAGHSLSFVAYAKFILEGHAASKAVFEEAIERMIAGGRPFNAVNDLCNLANNCAYNGEFENARRHIARAEEITARTGDPSSQCSILMHKAQAALLRREYADAERYCIEGFKYSPAATLGAATQFRARALHGMGRLAESWTCHRESMQYLRKNSMWLELVNTCESFAELLVTAGLARDAALLVGGMASERERIQFPVGAQARLVLNAIDAALKGALPDDEREAQIAAGMRMDREASLAHAFGLKLPST
jgi:predicted ATPase/class 3 adenylate cyclase